MARADATGSGPQAARYDGTSARSGGRTQTMNETITTQAASESSRHYVGWGVVATAFTGVMVSFAPIVLYTFSLFLNPLHAAFGWKREAIGGTFALAAITVALVSPGIGLLLDRFPPRRIILPSILIFALALASLRRLGPNIRQVYFTFLCRHWSPTERAVCIYAHCSLVVLQTQRTRARGGSHRQWSWLDLHPPLIQWTIAHHRWRSAYICCWAALLFWACP
jgi:hypothetical protein